MEKAFQTWPPTLQRHDLLVLAEHAVTKAMSAGALMKRAEKDQIKTDADALSVQEVSGLGVLTSHAPFALFPSPFPRKEYEKALKLQLLFNELVQRISVDEEFMKTIFEPLSKVDDFTGGLYEIYTKIKSQEKKQRIVLGIHRSDYMLHHDLATNDYQIKQVELNTVSASFACLSTVITKLHQFLSDRYDFYNDADAETLDIQRHSLPNNSALQGLSQGIYEAWRLYGNAKAYVLFVVQPAERNVFDQRLIEYELFEKFKVKCIRRTLSQVSSSVKKFTPGDPLIVDGHEIAVVYFRSGYGPGDYPSKNEWNARLLIEQSYAIKCPTVAYQLVGAKKVQQVLAVQDQLERFCNAEEARTLRTCFTGIYSLDNNEDGSKNIEMALGDPNKFVLKPQREGGGNNYYGEKVKEKLKSMSREETSAYILMERILPPPYKNALVRDGIVIEADVVSELGVYGVYISDGKTTVANNVCGHLLRTKTANTDEGGVASGFAVIDSPLLID